MNLELLAMRWLKFDKKCWFALRERCPRYGLGLPDVLGITQGRYMIEIEIKRSASDFRADAFKRHRMNRGFNIRKQVKQFYYLMPEALAAKLKLEIPDYAGLMAAKDEYNLTVVKVAPVNIDSEKLNCQECVRLARMLGNHLFSAEQAKHNIQTRILETYDPYFWTYQI